MKKRFLITNSVYLLISSLISILLPNFLSIIYLLHSHKDLNEMDVTFANLYIAVILIISLSFGLWPYISGLMTLLQLKGKKTYHIAVLFDYIGVFINIAFIICLIISRAFEDHVTGFINEKKLLIVIGIISIIYIIPLIINRIALYKYRGNLSNKMVWKHFKLPTIIIIILVLIFSLPNSIKMIIVGIKKEKITDQNTYTYYDFKDELYNRALIYNGRNCKNYTINNTFNRTYAKDASSRFCYEFVSGEATTSRSISKDSDKKFPFLMYKGYTCWIKGNRDLTVTWNIYYVNGDIYATPYWHTYSLKEKKEVVVSEKKKITIYNAKKNYYIKGGGITSTVSGVQHENYPTTKDIYDSKCIEIMVVDKVDGYTLYEISEDLFY